MRDSLSHGEFDSVWFKDDHDFQEASVGDVQSGVAGDRRWDLKPLASNFR
jgi:hypothetical protein